MVDLHGGSTKQRSYLMLTGSIDPHSHVPHEYHQRLTAIVTIMRSEVAVTRPVFQIPDPFFNTITTFLRSAAENSG